MTNGRSTCKAQGGQRGFTLLEMIAALAILAFGIIAVLHAFSSSMRTTKVAEAYSVAAGLAQQVASDLERRQDLETGHMSGSFAGDDSYTWDADIEPTTSPSLLGASIVVSWQTGALSRHLRMFTCLRSPASPATGAAP